MGLFFSAPSFHYNLPFHCRMLNEYHDLYEMQRHRLEDVVTQLTHDQEQWRRASYDLSWRVAQEYDLQTLQRMQLNEKSWTKLAGHFAILLSGKDTQQVREACLCGREGSVWEGSGIMDLNVDSLKMYFRTLRKNSSLLFTAV